MDDFTNYRPDSLKRYMSETKEKEYLLIDVRQPVEYEAGHIPGSILMPLGELESRLFDLPDDRDLVFYCRSGARSTAAASLAVDAEVTEKNVAHLAGGMMGWDGHALKGYPQMQVFDTRNDVPTLLMTAMNLEKGAWRYYSEVMQRTGGSPLADTFDTLSKAEIGHAKTIYRFWKDMVSNPLDFDKLYDGLNGDMMEGGTTVTEAINRLERMDGPSCMGYIEMAIDIEYAAYDLYRNTAEKTGPAEARDAFLAIAQAEKGHMRALIKAIDSCTD